MKRCQRLCDERADAFLQSLVEEILGTVPASVFCGSCVRQHAEDEVWGIGIRQAQRNSKLLTKGALPLKLFTPPRRRLRVDGDDGQINGGVSAVAAGVPRACCLCKNCTIDKVLLQCTYPKSTLKKRKEHLGATPRRCSPGTDVVHAFPPPLRLRLLNLCCAHKGMQLFGQTEEQSVARLDVEELNKR